MFPQWRIASDLGRVTGVDGLTSYAGNDIPVTVAGVPVANGESPAAFPARYPPALTGTMYVATVSAVVVLDSYVDATATPALCTAGGAAVASALDARLDECVRSTDSFPTGCPFDLFDQDDWYSAVTSTGVEVEFS
jgi:hypothetical protein